MDINEKMKLHQWAIDMNDQKESGLSQKDWCASENFRLVHSDFDAGRLKLLWKNN